MRNGKGADGVVREDQGLLQVDSDVSIQPETIIWPIFVTLDLRQVTRDRCSSMIGVKRMKEEWNVVACKSTMNLKGVPTEING